MPGTARPLGRPEMAALNIYGSFLKCQRSRFSKVFNLGRRRAELYSTSCSREFALKAPQQLTSAKRSATDTSGNLHSQSVTTSQCGSNKEKITVLFCGKEFPHTVESARDELSTDYEVLSVKRSEIRDALSKYSAQVLVPLMCRIDRDLIEFGARNGLKLIHQFGTGLEGVDLEAAAATNIPVINIPAKDCGNASSCAEHVFWMLLSLLRLVAHEPYSPCRAASQFPYRSPVEMERTLDARQLGTPLGAALTGRAALIIGFGSIGRELAPRLHSFGLRVLAVRAGSWPDEDRCAPTIIG